MTAREILKFTRTAGVVLEARGDRLHVEAPAGAVTRELRDALARRKAELLELLEAGTDRYVTLRPMPGVGALTVPVAALRLAWALEARGYDLTRTPGGDVRVTPTAGLTAEDRAGLRCWAQPLAALVAYVERIGAEVPA